MMTLMSGLVRSNLVVAGGTAVSRLTGLARVVVFGIIVGQTAVADAFEAANNAPNALYELLLGGVFSATLVPLFVGLLGGSRTEDDDVNAVFSTSLVVLIVTTVLAIIASPWIFHLFSLSPADGIDVEAFRQAGTALTRIFVVQVLFYGIIAMTSAILNARSRFFAAAWSPALANLVAIGFFLAIPLTGADNPPQLADVTGIDVTLWTLGLSTTLGIGAIAVVQIAAVHRSGITLRFRPKLSNPSVRRLLRLSTWTIGYVIANQVAIIVVKNLASPGSGLVDAYGKAFVLFQLPHGLLAVSIATTFVPMLARHVQANDFRAFGERMSQGLRLTILVTLPASISALVLSTPIVYIVLGYGNFDAAAVTNTARALSGLAFGLVGFSVYLFALRGFYARSDTRTPFLVNLTQNALNIALAFLLVDRFDVLGLGVAFGVSYIVGAIVAVYALGRAVPSWNASQLRVPVARHIGAGTVMTLLTVATTQAFDTTSRLTAVADILLSALVGLTAYIIVLAIAGDTDVRAGVARYSAASTTKSSR